MLASPSIQEIASALAPQLKPSVRSPSRILCLRLQEWPASGFKRSSRTGSTPALVEAFLKYSPRVQFRTASAREVKGDVSKTSSSRVASDEPCLVFIDIASTSHLFQGEEGLMRSAASLARDLGFGVQCAIA